MSDLWFGTSGPQDARIAIVGEAWGAEEELAQRPFVGSAGQLLDKMLAEASIYPAKVFKTNIVAARPDNNEFWRYLSRDKAVPEIAGLRPLPIVLEGLDRLYEQLDAVQPDLVIAAGNYPLWALTNCTRPVRNPQQTAITGQLPFTPSGIGAYRGSQIYRIRHWKRDRSNSSQRLLPIFHPASILRSWADRPLTVHDLRNRVPLALSNKWERTRPYSFVHRPSFEQVVGTLSSWLYSRTEVTLVCDIETKLAKFITCIGLSSSPDSAICIPFIGDPRTFEAFWSVREETTIRRILALLFEAPHIKWVGQNFMYDMAWLRNEYVVAPEVEYDTMVMQNLLFPGSQKDLGYLSSLYCDHHRYWKDDDREWDETGSLDEHLLYNCEDCARTYEVYLALKHHLASARLDHLWPFERYKIRLADRMANLGILTDTSARGAIALDLIDQRGHIAAFLQKIVPQSSVESNTATAWWDSAQQTAFVLYDLFGMKKQFNRKTKALSTDDESINALKELYPHFKPFFQAILDYRSLKVYHSTFIEAKLEPHYRRFGTHFNPAGTETFRWSSSKNPFKRGGNMQNVPAGEDE